MANSKIMENKTVLSKIDFSHTELRSASFDNIDIDEGSISGLLWEGIGFRRNSVDGTEFEVGEIKGQVFDFSDYTGSIWEILDADSDDAELMSLFSIDDDYDEELINCLGIDLPTRKYRFLHIHLLYIRPDSRGFNFTQTFFSEAINKYGPGCDFAVLCVSPLGERWHREGHYDLSTYLDTDEKTSQRKLTNHYSACGFKQIPNSSLMVKAIN